jgi:hypothetical protein
MAEYQIDHRCNTAPMYRPFDGDRSGSESPTRVEVDGELFDVAPVRDRPGQYRFTWVSGPNSGYGFSAGTSDGRAMSSAEMDAGIRKFLAQVDPETGYIE